MCKLTYNLHWAFTVSCDSDPSNARSQLNIYTQRVSHTPSTHHHWATNGAHEWLPSHWPISTGAFRVLVWLLLASYLLPMTVTVQNTATQITATRTSNRGFFLAQVSKLCKQYAQLAPFELVLLSTTSHTLINHNRSVADIAQLAASKWLPGRHVDVRVVTISRVLALACAY